MKLLLATRHELIAQEEARQAAAVLFEGSWPQGGVSLDDAIDARYSWIDEAAVYWAECLDVLSASSDVANDIPVHTAWLNALALRYYLVKLLRVVAFFTDVRPLKADDQVELVAEWGRDRDYVDLVVQLCERAGAALHVKWLDRPTEPPAAFPPNRRWRRLAAHVAEWLEPKVPLAPSPRIVLCGNPRLLDPVCQELRRRDCHQWWLYDRFAFGSWLRWRPRGVGQLVCDSSEGQENRLAVPAIERVECHGVDLAGTLRRWFAARVEACGPRQTRIIEQIDQHFARLRPDALVLDEDATPLARAAVALARRHGAMSFVVQHGAPCCQFGFAPLAADRFLAWGQSSADQLTRWAIPPERIDIVGSPQHDRLHRQLAKPVETTQRFEPESVGSIPKRDSSARSFKILLLATVPPRDDRPDAAGLHMTGRGYAEMLWAAITTVAAIPRAQLVVKLHPRAPHDPILEKLLSTQPLRKARVVRKASLARCLRGVDCVISCGSSAGIDATLAGLPVIQLLPAGSGDVLPYDQWGLVGTARSSIELKRLLEKVLEGNGQPAAVPNPHVFAGLSGSAQRIADVVLATYERPALELPCPTPAESELTCSTQG